MTEESKRQRALSHEQSKVRVLAIARMLDEGRRITSNEILGRLAAQYGITADRKTIYSDICAIDRIMPIDVKTGKNGGYMKWNFFGGGEKMANEKLINQICTIQRGLGIIEGVASGLANDAASQMLYTATEMIDEAVEVITKDGN